ncbi:NepR family anti-sigma factor [Pseudoroseicyclus aestuarii]|uniref:NepR family anti-sigma factor n=1 Tax=Pseudoroseicyclus aestuarii TaxID=1795041 RepID=UPI000DA213DF|nr:NepR family anti-sigma factor [Pseudoroseicyclus aestuarii]
MTQKDPRSARGEDIDAHLKRAFREITDEGLPDRFSSLLERLREGQEPEGAASTAGQSSEGEA